MKKYVFLCSVILANRGTIVSKTYFLGAAFYSYSKKKVDEIIRKHSRWGPFLSKVTVIKAFAALFSYLRISNEAHFDYSQKLRDVDIF